MDNFDFAKIDKELRDSNEIFDWNPRMTDEESPPKFILILIGEYDGVDLPDITIGIPCEFFSDPDDPKTAYSNYIVWLKVPNPEYGEMI